MMPGLGLYEWAKFNYLESALQFLRIFFALASIAIGDALVYSLTISYQDQISVFVRYRGIVSNFCFTVSHPQQSPPPPSGVNFFMNRKKKKPRRSKYLTRPRQPWFFIYIYCHFASSWLWLPMFVPYCCYSPKPGMRRSRSVVIRETRRADIVEHRRCGIVCGRPAAVK